MSSPKDKSSSPNSPSSSSITTNLANAASQGNFDSQQLVNMVASAYMVNLMSSLKKTTFQPRIIGIFLLMISLNEIKGCISDSIKFSKKQLPKLFTTLGQLLLTILKRLNPVKMIKSLGRLSPCHLLTYRKSPIPDKKTIDEETRTLYEIDIHMEPNLYNMTALHQYFLANQIGHHNRNFRLKSESANDHHFQIEYDDLEFIHETMNIRIPRKLTVYYDIDNNVRSFLIDLNPYKKENSDVERWTRYVWVDQTRGRVRECLLQNLDKYGKREIKPEYTRNYNYIKNENLRDNLKSTCFYQDPNNTKIDLGHVLLSYVIESLYVTATNYDSVSQDFFNKETMIVLCLIDAIGQVYSSESTFWIDLGSSAIGVYAQQDKITCYYNRRLRDAKGSIKGFEGKQLYLNKFRIEDYLVPQVTKTNNDLKFQVTSLVPVNRKELYDQFTHFFQNKILAADTKKNSDVITVYSVNFNRIETTKEITNPEFTRWQEQIDAINGLQGEPDEKEGKGEEKETGKGKTEKKVVNPLARFNGPGSKHIFQLYSRMPARTIFKKEIDYKLECKVINKVSKRLETLYIRENDKKLLVNMLGKFKNKRDLYYELGIPYKLGMLFHGQPGTGKTSAIKAVASYLNKDIYFIHLKNVKTNRDLKEIFEHINHKCNGGVIVLEDIDAATDVVYRRDQVESVDSSEASSSAVAKTLSDCLEESDDALTLSYLLNLLDGTLCSDGTIFAITTNHLEKLDPALYRKGRVDLTIEFKRCDHYQIKEIYQAILNREVPSALLERIPEDTFPPCEVIFHVYQYLLNDDYTDEYILKPFLLQSA